MWSEAWEASARAGDVAGPRSAAGEEPCWCRAAGMEGPRSGRFAPLLLAFAKGSPAAAQGASPTVWLQEQPTASLPPLDHNL